MYIVLFISKKRLAAFATGIIFLFSAAHWRVPIWITTQGQLLQTFFFLTTSISLSLYLFKKNKVALFLALTSYLLMIASFTSTFEIPLIYAIMTFFFLYSSGIRKKTSLISAIKIFSYFSLILIIYLLFRFYFLETSKINNYSGKINYAISHFFQILLETAKGIFINFTSSYFGGILFAKNGTYTLLKTNNKGFLSVTTSLQIFTNFAVFIFLIFINYKNQIRNKTNRNFLNQLSLLLIGCALIIYSLPAIGRVDSYPNYFAVRSRYCYLPNVFIAPLFILTISRLSTLKHQILQNKLFIFKSKNINSFNDNFLLEIYYYLKSSIPNKLLSFFYFIILFSNIYFISNQEKTADYTGNILKEKINDFVIELNYNSIHQNNLIVKNNHLKQPKHTYANWNVSPLDVCKIYAPDDCKILALKE